MSENPIEKKQQRMMSTLVDELRQRQARALEMGGEEGLKKHRESGRLPVRERVELMIDVGSWFEIGSLALPELRTSKHIPGDAVVTGFARVDGRQVGLIGIDSSVVAGTTAPISMKKQGRLIEHCQQKGLPIVLLCDADGGRIPDVMGWRFSNLPLDFKSFLKSTDGKPLVPRAAAVLGPSYGDSALHASTAHFVVMIKNASLALVGPAVIESALGEELSDAELGGPDKAIAAGNAHLAVETEADAMEAIAAFLSYLPSNASLPAPVAPAREPAVSPDTLDSIVPLGAKTGYDMYNVLEAIVDESSILPWGDDWGPALITAFARIEGNPVGVVASQPMIMAGALDARALTKERDFIDLCDTFNIPLVFLHDVPGLMVGAHAEKTGILKAYEKLALRMSEAKVPKVGVVIRKAYGGGHFAMGGRPTHPDFLFAWPSAELGFMAPEAGVRITYRRRLEKLAADEGDAEAKRLEAELYEEWAAESEPWEAAAHISIDDVIEPTKTRAVIIAALEVAWGEKPERVV